MTITQVPLIEWWPPYFAGMLQHQVDITRGLNTGICLLDCDNNIFTVLLRHKCLILDMYIITGILRVFLRSMSTDCQLTL